MRRNRNVKLCLDVLNDRCLLSATPIVGDWNGDHIDTIGVVRRG